MSNFLLETICDYLRQGKILIKFNQTHCIEKDIHSMTIYNKKGEKIEDFKIRKGDKAVITLIAEVEGLKDVIRC